MSSSAATISSKPVSRERAGLALICGALGVPGSTIAWDLPAGGYWIGMPLAAVAIVLGVMATSRAVGRRRGMAVAAIVLGAVEVLFTASYLVFS
ncbi:MAG: hypothetical protein QOE10_601 [Gaiellales bacterium]|jgi:hypothetical protein|nr:hypothetical protein [Gaiellales bacterium]